MKKTEAISILATSVRPREAKDRARYDEAVKMAIEALKSSERTAETAQNAQDEDLISRKAAIEALARMMPRSYTPDGSHPADEEIFRAQEVFADCIEALEILPSAQPEIIRCRDCKHKPYPSDNYCYDNADCGFEIIFPDYRCPCRCDDEYYNYIPDDNWFCGNAERRTDE